MSPLRLPCASPNTPFVTLCQIPWGGSPLSLLAAGLPATARPGCCWAGLIHSGVCPQGRFRVSHVPWEPQCALAVLLDPGRTSAPGSSRRSGAAPAVLTTKAPTLSLFRCSITRLRHWLFTLRAAISGDYAKLASGGGQPFPGGIGYPLSSSEQFLLSRFPCSWAFHGATDILISAERA